MTSPGFYISDNTFLPQSFHRLARHPRFPPKGKEDIFHFSKSAETFAAYLLPDQKYGFEYLEMVQAVLSP